LKIHQAPTIQGSRRFRLARLRLKAFEARTPQHDSDTKDFNKRKVFKMSAFASFFHVRALEIQKSLGNRCAAGFLRNRNVPLKDALFILVGRV
jgi:hypothetical protein